MNRRRFISSLAVAAASLYLPKLPGRFHWKVVRWGGLYKINPEWINAPYEVGWWIIGPMDFARGRDRAVLLPVVFKRGLSPELQLDSPKYLPRLTADGQWVVPHKQFF
jgi:hypothetical protein